MNAVTAQAPLAISVASLWEESRPEEAAAMKRVERRGELKGN